MIYLIYLILLTLPAYLLKFRIFGIPTTILEVEIYILAVWFVIYNLKKGSLYKLLKDFVNPAAKRGGTGNPFFIPLALFFIGGLLAVFVSPDEIKALGIFKAYFFDAVLFLFLFVSLVKTKKQVRNSFIAIAFSGLILSLIGLAHFIWFPEFLQEGRIRSVFSSPNYLSLYITPILFLLFYLWLGIKKRFGLFILLISYFLILLTLVLTYSRGAWLAFLVSLLFYIGIVVAKRFRKLRIVVVTSFIITVALVVLFVTYGAYALKIMPSNRVVMSDNVRVEIWKTSWEIGKKNWLVGVGLGNFQNYFGEYTKNRINYPEYITPHAITPHNVFLNVWLQVGLAGLLGLLGLLGLFFYYGYRGLRDNFLLSAVVLTSMVAILTQGLVDSAIWKNDLIIYFWFLVGCMLINCELDTN